jgi:hypothetical protein
MDEVLKHGNADYILLFHELGSDATTRALFASPELFL